ncbi:MAG: hypothetical protein LBK67_07245, partial [Coriobacteriales bacterium]|nr:hypothetical protein [Coriobacteriales bacterium]
MISAAREYLTFWIRQDSVSRARWLGRSLSFSLIWTWCALLARTDVFPITVIDALGLPGADAPLLASNVLVLLILIAICWKMSSLLDSKTVMTATTIALSAGSLLVVLGQAYQSLLLCYLGVFLGGAAIATLKISWGEMYSRVRLDEGLMLIGTALIASSLLIAVALILPTVLVETLFIICGVSCVPFLRFGTRQKDYAVSEIRHSSRQRLKASWTFLALPILVAVTFGAFHGATGIGAEQFDTEKVANFGMLTAPISAFLSGFLLMVVATRHEDRLKPAQIYAWALIMLVVGFVLLAMGLILPVVGNIILVTGFLLFYFFMIVFWG